MTKKQALDLNAHTPGPWRIKEEHGWPLVGTNDCKLVAKVDTSTNGHVFALPTARANARLIAAAPDLLAACEAVLEWVRTPGNHGGNPYCKAFVKLAGEAIAKAYGTVPGTGYVQDSREEG